MGGLVITIFNCVLEKMCSSGGGVGFKFSWFVEGMMVVFLEMRAINRSAFVVFVVAA